MLSHLPRKMSEDARVSGALTRLDEEFNSKSIFH